MAIKRREFIQGIAVASAMTQTKLASALDATGLAIQQTGTSPNQPAFSYPPKLTGLRGSHPGSFEVAHAIALGNQSYPIPESYTDELYDLIVVGAGISGLASAWYYRKENPNAKILLLDNHDDLGGHAKRNEFEVDGRKLIGYGGSQSIEAPAHYSAEARQLLKDIGIDTEKFYTYYDREFATRSGLGSLWFFDKAHYQVDKTVTNPLGASWAGVERPEDIGDAVEQMPLSSTEQAALKVLLTSDKDWLAGKTIEQKVEYLRGKSYENYLRDDLAMPDGVILMLRNRAHGLWAVGYDALSALAAAKSGEPGTVSLGLDEYLWGDEEDEPYIFHFPDGNATIARRLAQQLIPQCISADTVEALACTPLDYSTLDNPGQPTRIRLNAMAIDVQHVPMHAAVKGRSEEGRGEEGSEENGSGEKGFGNKSAGQEKTLVAVTYVNQNKTYRVRAKQAIMGCYNHVLPSICPELPPEQVDALKWPEKAPLVYTNVALKNWHAFKKAGMYHFASLRDFWCYGMLDFPVSIPGYHFAETPDDPIILHLVHVPTSPGRPVRQQYREGRRKLLAMTFDNYETEIRRQLTAMLGEHGFDFDRDVEAITVNRWPHGYAYEYVDLWDPADWNPQNGPHLTARKPFGQVAIANSDSSAYAYVNGAIDAAWRAVNELKAL